MSAYAERCTAKKVRDEKTDLIGLLTHHHVLLGLAQSEHRLRHILGTKAARTLEIAVTIHVGPRQNHVAVKKQPDDAYKDNP